MPSNAHDPNYYRGNFMEDVKRPYDKEVVDPMSQHLLDIIEGIDTYVEHTYSDGEVFTTLVYRAYGNTSLWWLVLHYNGLFSPLDLIPGMIIRFPEKRAVSEVIRQLVISQNKYRVVKKVVL